jgi:hypothetical protein
LHQENPRASPEAKQRLGNIYKYKNKFFSLLCLQSQHFMEHKYQTKPVGYTLRYACSLVYDAGASFLGGGFPPASST